MKHKLIYGGAALVIAYLFFATLNGLLYFAFGIDTGRWLGITFVVVVFVLAWAAVIWAIRRRLRLSGRRGRTS